MFSTEVRYKLAQESTKDIKNVIVHPTGDYLISSATFPSYFIKEKARVENIHCELDLIIFRDYFAKELGITKRFVGTEPYCKVSAAPTRT